MLVIHDTAIHRIGYDFYADIAERIVEGRKTLGLTQIQFAKKVKMPVSKLAQYEEVRTRYRLADLETFAQQLDTNINQLIGAEYDDVDCGECLYTVRNERYDKLWGESRNFALYFKSSSPQMAFLKAYEFSREKRFRWFESRDRAIVKLVGVPVKKTDYANKFKPIDAKADDLIELEKENQ